MEGLQSFIGIHTQRKAFHQESFFVRFVCFFCIMWLRR